MLLRKNTTDELALAQIVILRESHSIEEKAIKNTEGKPQEQQQKWIWLIHYKINIFFLTSNPYYLLHSVLYASNLHPVNDCDQGTC